MRKTKSSIIGIVAFALFAFHSMTAFAEEPIDINRHVPSFQDMPLTQLAVEDEQNIVLIDEEGYTLYEFHSDGYVAEFIYSETYSANFSRELSAIVGNDGRIDKFSYGKKGNLAKIDIYTGDKYIGTKGFPTTQFNGDVIPATTYSDFYVYHDDGKKTKMNSLISDSQFVRKSTSATQQDIQELFNTTGSPLKNKIAIYKKDSNGNVYATGVTITPAKVIYDASVTYSVSPKVILATLQKESSLVSNKRVNESLSTSYFYFCMGAGSSSSTTNTGFDAQIDYGTSILHKWYQYGIDNYSFPYYYSNSGFRGYRGYGTTDYLTSIWCDNAATYSLYKYTPFTCRDNEKTGTANVLFLEIYNGSMLSDFPE